jgi:hypothetical protein
VGAPSVSVAVGWTDAEVVGDAEAAGAVSVFVVVSLGAVSVFVVVCLGAVSVFVAVSLGWEDSVRVGFGSAINALRHLYSQA